MKEATGMIAVDVGGTFTDVIGVRDGEIEATKVPTNRRSPELGAIRGGSSLGLEDRRVFNHASTVGLNAVLTRQLPKIGFLTTLGHRDMLDGARSWRSFDAITDVSYRRSFSDVSRPLVPRYLRRGIRERMLASGECLIPFDAEFAYKELERLRKCDVEGVAICLVNAYANPEHERLLGEMVAERLGDVPYSLSCEVSPVAREYQRASTTVIDVFMKIIFGKYSESLEKGLAQEGFDGALNFADCAAMLLTTERARRQPFKVVFAGPAAGTVASARFGSLVDDPNLICCDVGGTSCDISVVTRGEPFLNTTVELEPEMFVNTLSVDLSTLGAGGSSIASVNSAGELRVGPESAGADPGPACYGHGGKAPTVTDACLLIGLLDGTKFNAGKMQLDPELSVVAFESLHAPQLSLEQRVSYTYQLAINNIAEGLVDVAVRQGTDPRDYSLMAYGAAGPLLLPAVLDEVHARRVVVPPYPGLFSALGLLSSDLVFSDERSSYITFTSESVGEIDAIFADMESKLRTQLGDREVVQVKRTFDGRLVGQSWETPFVGAPEGEITPAEIEGMIKSFHDVYAERFGNRFEHIAVQGVTYRVQLIVAADKVDFPEIEASGEVVTEDEVELAFIDDGNVRAQVYERASLPAGASLRGPAIIREPMSTTHVLAKQRVDVGRFGEFYITRDTTTTESGRVLSGQAAQAGAPYDR